MSIEKFVESLNGLPSARNLITVDVAPAAPHAVELSSIIKKVRFPLSISISPYKKKTWIAAKQDVLRRERCYAREREVPQRIDARNQALSHETQIDGVKARAANVKDQTLATVKHNHTPCTPQKKNAKMQNVWVHRLRSPPFNFQPQRINQPVPNPHKQVKKELLLTPQSSLRTAQRTYTTQRSNAKRTVWMRDG